MNTPKKEHIITADQTAGYKKRMSKETALEVLQAEERWGKGVVRKEFVEEARQVLNDRA